MSRFSFGRVDGLEISRTLAEIAQNNFSILKKANVRIFHVDARNFKSFHEYNFFYLYNPFPESVMVDVMNNLTKQLGNKEATLIYNNPVCHAIVEKAGFKKYKEYPDQWGNGIFVYSNNAASNRLRRIST